MVRITWIPPSEGGHVHPEFPAKTQRDILYDRTFVINTAIFPQNHLTGVVLVLNDKDSIAFFFRLLRDEIKQLNLMVVFTVASSQQDIRVIRKKIQDKNNLACEWKVTIQPSHKCCVSNLVVCCVACATREPT